MKKYFIFGLIFGTLLSGCTGRSSENTSSETGTSLSNSSYEDSSMISSQQEIGKIWDSNYRDSTHGFGSLGDISVAKYYRNNELLSSFDEELRASADHKFEFYNHSLSHVRYVDKSNGFALTFPLDNQAFQVDYTLAKYQLKVRYQDATITTSMEKNAYSGDANGYHIYVSEWYDRYIHNPKYLEDNNLEYFKSTTYRSQSYLDGFEVSIWNIRINDACQIEQPYYHIAILRELNQYQKMLYLNIKSSKDESSLLNKLIQSYRVVSARGTAKNYMTPMTAEIDPIWNEDTKAYYQKLLKKEAVDFGMFTKSMPNDYSANWYNIDHQLSEQMTRLQSSETGIGHTWEIIPTYTHISWYNELHHFPNEMAKKYAQGNGYNNKPVLQFTYQFTTNNNAVTPGNTTNLYTPMFDILRGKYDQHFRKLARDIKSYEKPVLFRLNNEMNTDWTSYCGMMTLNDPEIFNQTWRYLFHIFQDEGVNNALWIWNPAHTSIPYSNWGEDLAYFPGKEYVHILGLTHYEMNNRDGNIQSFKQMYTDVYQKNQYLFGALPWIISEFACGSGGNADGSTLYRNQPSQAAWVAGMMNDWKHRATNPFVQNIVGAIWFNCHDYAGDLIVNALALDAPLVDTIAAFRNGFNALN